MWACGHVGKRKAEYESATQCHGELFGVQKDGKWGYVNAKNQVVIPFEYDDISAVDNGLAYAVKNETVYIITIS